jgi:hypothetical protein
MWRHFYCEVLFTVSAEANCENNVNIRRSVSRTSYALNTHLWEKKSDRKHNTHDNEDIHDDNVTETISSERKSERAEYLVWRRAKLQYEKKIPKVNFHLIKNA